jgi:hypothetical protein
MTRLSISHRYLILIGEVIKRASSCRVFVIHLDVPMENGVKLKTAEELLMEDLTCSLVHANR